VSADPFLLRTVHDTTGATVAVTAPLVHECPHVPETDAGEVTITWRTEELTVELHSLSAYLASWARESISHEEVTAQIRADLDAIDGLEVLSVVTRWRTAGMAVTVTR
jgi:NADPH-dependent 7-cyano-7-deazaguanine reductase QueF